MQHLTSISLFSTFTRFLNPHFIFWASLVEYSSDSIHRGQYFGPAVGGSPKAIRHVRACMIPVGVYNFPHQTATCAVEYCRIRRDESSSAATDNREVVKIACPGL